VVVIVSGLRPNCKGAIICFSLQRKKTGSVSEKMKILLLWKPRGCPDVGKGGPFPWPSMTGGWLVESDGPAAAGSPGEIVWGNGGNCWGLE